MIALNEKRALHNWVEYNVRLSSFCCSAFSEVEELSEDKENEL